MHKMKTEDLSFFRTMCISGQKRKKISGEKFNEVIVDCRVVISRNAKM